MTYLLDTCIVSKLRKINTHPDAILKNWVLQHSENQFYLSVLTIGEIQAGIAKLDSKNPREKKQRMILEDWLFGELVQRFKDRILNLDIQVAFTWGKLHGNAKQKGINIPIGDGLIAATALCHGLIVVTKNMKQFVNTGVEVFNPWEAR